MPEKIAKMPAWVVSNRGTEAGIFSQLLAVLGMVHVFPSERKIGEFICQALKVVPGLASCSICLKSLSELVGDMVGEQCLTCAEFKEDTDNLAHYNCLLSEQTDISIFPLETSYRFYGFMVVRVEQGQGFDPYEPFLQNFANSITITLENRWQHKRLETTNAKLNVHQDHLEDLVEERTEALKAVNAQLRDEITERKRAERDIQNAQEYAVSIVETVREPMLILNADLRLISANHAFYQTFQMTAEESVGVSIFELGNRQWDIPKLRELLEEILPENSPFENYEMEHVFEPIGRRTMLLNARRLQTEADKTQMILLAIEDITERKRVEEALLEKEKFFSATLDDMLTFVAVLEPDGTVIFVNNTPLDVAGITLDDVQGKMFYDAFWWQHSEEVRQRMKDYIESCASGETLVHDIEIQTARRGLMWIEYSMHPIYDEDGHIKYLVPEGRDISGRKQTESELRKYREHLEELVKDRTIELGEKTAELEAANIELQAADRLKSVFLASMSHELRTPLNSIIGFTGIILQGMVGKITKEQRKQLTIVKKSANHLLDLVNDLLDISKIEAGRVELSWEEFKLTDVLGEVLEAIAPTVNEKGLDIYSEGNTDITLYSDRRRVKQIILNLMSNAIKFTEHGNIKLKTRVWNDEQLEIHVIDTGIGIKKDDLPQLFAPFRQIDVSLAKRYEGTGLGLYLSRKLVNLLDGEIRVNSEYGRGSDFIFVLPINRRNKEQ